MPDAVFGLPQGGDLEDIFLGKIEKRAFEECRKGKVVRRQKHEAAERQEVLDGDVVRQPQAVGARHRNIVAPLEGAGERIDETVALAHQDENVACFDRPFRATLDDGLLADQRGQDMGDPPGQDGGGRAFRRGIEGGGPILLGGSRLRRDHLPEIDGAGMADAAGAVHHRITTALSPRAFIERKHLVDGGEHVGSRAEREGQADRRKLLAARRHAPPRPVAFRENRSGRAPWKE